jgi:mono/diheme cytochrome c family protein
MKMGAIWGVLAGAVVAAMPGAQLLAQAPDRAPSVAAGHAVPTVGAAAPAGAATALAATTAPATGAAVPQPPAPTNTPGPYPRGPQGVREFLGLGPAPDAAAAKRGAPVFAANCAFCHGPQARGAEGPSLIYSELVLKDEHGKVIAEFLKAGRPEKGMPAFATLSDDQRTDIAEFLHQQVEDVANRGTYEIKNIVLGDPKKGARYVAAHCLSCHSVSGDLKGLGAKWRPADLQRNWIMPPRTGDHRAITATVRDPQRAWEGRVQQIDDFRIVLINTSGQLMAVERSPGVTVELHDPLAPHVAMVGNLADPDMINVTAYLEALK